MTTTVPRFVRDIMTRNVVTLYEEDNLSLAEEGMSTYAFRHLPVVDDGKLVGLVTERDILRASVSLLDDDHALRDDNLKRYVFVRAVMTLEVATVRPDTLLSDAARLMKEHKFGCLPVTLEDGTLVGIVTTSDFLGLALGFLNEGELARLERAMAASVG